MYLTPIIHEVTLHKEVSCMYEQKKIANHVNVIAMLYDTFLFFLFAFVREGLMIHSFVVSFS